jgi:lysophospholipase L1-like esterase
VFLTTLTPVIAERYFDFCSRAGLNREHILAWLGTKERIARFHAAYSCAVERIASEEGCPLIDLYRTFYRQKNMGALFCVDGAHPNDAGQALIAETVLEALATA